MLFAQTRAVPIHLDRHETAALADAPWQGIAQ